MAESADGVQAVVLQRVFKIIAEIGIIVENGEIHQVVDVSWLELRWIGHGIGCSLGYGPDCQFNSPPPFAWRTQRAKSLRDKRRLPPGSMPQWFRRVDE